MKRLALASFLVGAVVGCAAYTVDHGPDFRAGGPEHDIPPAFLQEMARDLAKIVAPPSPLHCWASDQAIPDEFGGMTVLAISEESRLYILGREGRTTLIGEIVPGVACILSEGSEA